MQMEIPYNKLLLLLLSSSVNCGGYLLQVKENPDTIFFVAVSREELDSVKGRSGDNTWLLPHAKMLLVATTFFLCRVDYALEENVMTEQM